MNLDKYLEFLGILALNGSTGDYARLHKVYVNWRVDWEFNGFYKLVVGCRLAVGHRQSRAWRFVTFVSTIKQK